MKSIRKMELKNCLAKETMDIVHSIKRQLAGQYLLAFDFEICKKYLFFKYFSHVSVE